MLRPPDVREVRITQERTSGGYYHMQTTGNTNRFDVNIPVSVGELLDKLSILKLKTEFISDVEKLHNITHELQLLSSKEQALPIINQEAIDRLKDELYQVNKAIWNTEDDIRECESRHDFGEQFIALARAVYHNNDRRSRIKRQINCLCQSTIIEEKSYRDYQCPS